MRSAITANPPTSHASERCRYADGESWMRAVMVAPRMVTMAGSIWRTSAASAGTSAPSEKLKRAIAYIHDQLQTSLTVSAIAREVDITGGAGARIIFDPIAGPLLDKLAEAAAPGATIF